MIVAVLLAIAITPDRAVAGGDTPYAIASAGTAGIGTVTLLSRG